MNEDYLQYIWRYQRLPHADLTCVSGRILNVIFQGHWNKHAGPDFLEARIRIGKEQWIGSVEVHVKSSEWRKHRHQSDPAYTNVVLHVVYEDDEPLINAAGEEVPTIELKGMLDSSHVNAYAQFIERPEYLSCSGRLGEVEAMSRQAWLHRMAVERLQERAQQIEVLLEETKYDWNQVWWRLLARCFGFGLNQQGFEYIAQSVSWVQLARISDRPFSVEALLLFHSSWVHLDKRLAIVQKLKSEYDHLSRLWGLTPAPLAIWRRGRMNPANSPRIRLGQLGALIHKGWLSWGKVRSFESLTELVQELEQQVSFSQLTSSGEEGKTNAMGVNSRHGILANGVIPLLFCWARAHDDQEMIERSLEWQDLIPPEDHKVTRLWKKEGWKAESLLESQGQLHLHRSYCTQKKCVSCLVGITLLNH
ncbi:MAG: DUF2851 family protein [Flavobacteriales bacterium]|nr:DUF2851 family protein [Flavobacteriales bacterium]MDG1780391.1 DUF2851 family protein [Flavobacteriales bacterium]MDG2246587.1 DUF2851 family protein [Flavobacteriales bacterium]